mmetsp:Transcript_7021/g.15319  ORF Transcript_7021/g.15319 Transcript_7021/m.15319 type:complete len:592 (-) Transcript_7021:2309-4084(-)
MVQYRSPVVAVFALLLLWDEKSNNGRVHVAAFLPRSSVPYNTGAQRQFFTIPRSSTGCERYKQNRISDTLASSDLRLAGTTSGGVNRDRHDRQQHQHLPSSATSGSTEQQADVSIGVGSSLTIPDGVLSFPTTLLVEGSVSGKIDCAQPRCSPGTRVTVARTGTIEGDVACAETVEVYGKVVGRIECKYLTVVAGAEVIGDVVCGSIFLEPGATVLGVVQCGAAVEDKALAASPEEHGDHAPAAADAGGGGGPAANARRPSTSSSSSRIQSHDSNTLAAAIGRMGRGWQTDVGKKNVVRQGADSGSPSDHIFGGKEKVNAVHHTHSSADDIHSAALEADSSYVGDNYVVGHRGGDTTFNEQTNGGSFPSPDTRVDGGVRNIGEHRINGDSSAVNGEAYASVSDKWGSGDSSSASFDDGEILAYLGSSAPPGVEEPSRDKPLYREVEAPLPTVQETAEPSSPHPEHTPRVLDKHGKISAPETLKAIKELYEKESDEPFYVDNFGNPLYRSANEDEVNSLRQNHDLLNNHRKYLEQHLEEKRRPPELDARQQALLDNSEVTFRRNSEMRWDASGKDNQDERNDNYVPDFLKES